MRIGVTPIIGEFGWFLFDTLPHLRWCKENLFKHDTMVVFAPPAWHCLLEFADECYSLPGITSIDWPMEFHGIDHRQYHNPRAISQVKDLINHAKQIDHCHHWYELSYWNSDRWPEVIHQPLASRNGTNADCTVVAARARDFGGTKNWASSCWDALCSRIEGEVYSIGSSGEAYFPKGTIPVKSNLKESIRILSTARCSISSNSGATHLSLLCQCPTFVWGAEDYRRRMEKETNPFSTPIKYLGVGWNPEVTLILGEFLGWNIGKTVTP